jgi:LPXTG-motif cell wall-anchored protein
METTVKRLVTLASAVLLVLLIVAGPASAQVDSLGPDETSVLPRTLPRPPGEIGVEDDVIQRGTPVSTAAVSPTTGVAGIQIDRGPLAQTGIQVTTGALLAAILLAGGGLVLVTTRRRSVLA